MARSRLVKRFKRRAARSNPAPKAKHNPPMLVDIALFAGPALGAFGATHLATRGVATQIEKRFPKWGRHAGGLAAAASFLGAWFLAHRWKPIAPYHTPIVIGSALAAAQELLTLYVPKIAWAFNPTAPAELGAGAQTQGQIAIHDDAGGLVDADDFEVMDDDGIYDFQSEARDPGPTYRSAPRPKAAPSPRAQAAQAAQANAAEDDIFDALDDDDLQGVFAGQAGN